jgi:hypothetical protein
MSRVPSLVLLSALSLSACQNQVRLLSEEPKSPASNGDRGVTPVERSAPRLDLSAVPFPTRTERLKIFDEVSSEMMRLDAEALEARRLRPESWKNTMRELRSEVAAAEDFRDLASVFTRLDATYTNLHSSVDFVADGEWFEPGYVHASAQVLTQLTDSGRSRFLLYFADKEWDEGRRRGLRSGDEVLSINGRSLESWSDENFLFCKFPLQLQCDQELFDNLVSGVLSWNRGDDLKLVVKKSESGERVTVKVPYEIRRRTAEQRQRRETRKLERLECARSPERYPGHRLAYAGNRACVFEKDGDPTSAVLRITSFSYSASRLLPDQKLRSVRQEVEALRPYWMEHAGAWKHLAIDVIDNNGGNAPIPYYELLFTDAFQEQYYRLKKIPELENREFLDGLLWSDAPQLSTYEMMRKDGSWDRTSVGKLLPAVPMFCRDDAEDCRVSNFVPRPHPFRGRVSLLMNRMCISSCDGFVWGVKSVLGERAKLYGQPQAADSTYSRARIDVEWTANEGFSTQVRTQFANVNDRTLFSQVVSVSLSTDAQGRPLAGRPLKLDRFVGDDPFMDALWPAKVLRASTGQ